MDVKGILLMENLEVFDYFAFEARSKGREIFTDNDNYMFIKGTDPTSRICLVAHVDMISNGTWHNGKRTGRAKKLVERYGVITAYYADTPKQRCVLGADDRAGCYGLLHIMRKDCRPHILLTNHEETGGVGAGVFTTQTTLWEHFDFMIELDRAGCNEYVQYNDNPAEVHTWMARFGIANGGRGSYSDIATISRATNIPSVNVAIGYRGQHSEREHLDIASMNLGIRKTELMIERYCKDKPELGRIKPYVETRERETRTVVYDWKEHRRLQEERTKCAECGGLDGEHYRSCPDYNEEESARQPGFNFGNQ